MARRTVASSLCLFTLAVLTAVRPGLAQPTACAGDCDRDRAVTTASRPIAAGALLRLLYGTAFACPGDCDDDCAVSVGELVASVGVALGAGQASSCPGLDADAGGAVTIDELVSAERQCAQPDRERSAGEPCGGGGAALQGGVDGRSHATAPRTSTPQPRRHARSAAPRAQPRGHGDRGGDQGRGGG